MMKITVIMEVENIEDYKYLQPVVSSQIRHALTYPAKVDDMEMTHQGVGCSSKITIEKE